MASIELTHKLDRLRETLHGYGSVLVAYSGGVDSTFLLKVAVDTLGRDKVLGVTARSESMTDRSFQLACDIAREHNLPQEILEHSDLAVQGYVENSVNRCYHCKKALFSRLREIAEARGFHAVLEGSNADDVGDYRPGMRASAELGTQAPMRDLGLTKAEIRDLARGLGLPNWDRPSDACLASRVPYGQRITQEKLDRVSAAEAYLQDLGLRQVRVRHHDAIARIEVPPEEMARLVEPATREALYERFRALGYQYVALDLRGYRTGSMNEVLAASQRGGNQTR